MLKFSTRWRAGVFSPAIWGPPWIPNVKVKVSGRVVLEKKGFRIMLKYFPANQQTSIDSQIQLLAYVKMK